MSRTRKNKAGQSGRGMNGTGKQIQHHGSKMSVKKAGGSYGKKAREMRK